MLLMAKLNFALVAFSLLASRCLLAKLNFALVAFSSEE
jgi:hypothetical protein